MKHQPTPTFTVQKITTETSTNNMIYKQNTTVSAYL